MKKFDLTKGLVTGTEWVSRLAILNLVWLLFSLPILTMIPATNTLFYILHQWSNGETSLPIFNTFWTHLKTHFWNGYKIGLPIFIVVIILFIDRWILNSISNPPAWVQIYLYVLYFFSILFSLTALFFAALSKKLTLTIPKQLLTSFLLMIGHPLVSLGLLATVLLLLLLFSIWPAMIFFFSASGIGWAATIAVKKAFTKMVQKNNVSSQ